MEPTLSIIVPIYNDEKYLAECVQSILGQTFCDYEIILVDDGSTDGSAKICDEFARQYDFISVIHGENRGVVTARKKGLSFSKGKYILYIDSDDIISPDMCDFMIGKIKEHDADICICGMIIEYKRETVYNSNFIKPGIYDKEALKKDFYPKMLFDLKNNDPAVNPSLGNKIIRRELLEKNLMLVDERITYGEDAMCTYPCLLDADRVYVADRKFFYRYRQINTSISHVYDEKLLYKFSLLVERLDRAFCERNFDAKDQLACYAAKHSAECIRKELLYNRSCGIKKRVKNVETYLEQPIIKDAFQTAKTKSFDKSTDIKIFLAARDKVFMLYILYYIRGITLKIRNCQK